MHKKHIYYFLVLLLLTVGCKKTELVPQKALTLEQEQLLLGNPSDATPDAANYANYLISRPQYALSYSRDRGIPNWVSWHVNQSWLGDAPRQDNFRSDPALPGNWNRVTSSDYTRSGFDRGHNVPSADRTKSEEDNAATFYMTNIIPQAPKNNQETWANLEDYTRQLIEEGMEVYVLMGNYGIGGTGSKGSAKTIDNGNITVPGYIWKVLVILPEGDNDLARITTDTRVIAVITPNQNNVNENWSTYRTTVDAIENATGYDLLSNVPVKVQTVLESKVDNGSTQ